MRANGFATNGDILPDTEILIIAETLDEEDVLATVAVLDLSDDISPITKIQLRL